MRATELSEHKIETIFQFFPALLFIQKYLPYHLIGNNNTYE